MTYLYIPENLDLCKIFNDQCQQDKAAYIVHTVRCQRIFDKRTSSDFVPLNAQVLKDKLGRDYKLVRDTLVKEGVLISDNNPIRGAKSTGFKLAGEFSDTKLKRYTSKSVELKERRLTGTY